MLQISDSIMSDDKNLTPSEEVNDAVPATPANAEVEDTSVDAIALEELVEQKEDQFSTPHDDFDWELGNGIASPYTDEEQKK